MKVAHFMPFPAVGGTEIATLRVIKAARTSGIEAIAFCFRPTPALRDFFGGNGVPVVDWKPPTPSITRGVAYFRQSRLLAQELRRRGVNLVHCQDVLAGLHGSLAGRLAGLPVLCHVRGRRDDISLRDSLFLRPTTKFVFVSKSAWRQLSFRVPKRKGLILYDGMPSLAAPVDLDRLRSDFLREFAIPFGSILVGMTGRVQRQKDYETLLRAAVDVKAKHPSAIFVIVGDYSTDEADRRHFETIKRLACDLSVFDSFRFVGFRRDITSVLFLFDIFVFSTNTEGFPLATLEAMASGRPVVATAVDGLLEQIEHGRNGLLVPHKDASALARALSSLIEQPELASRLGETARRFVAERFSDTQFRERICELYASFHR